VRKYHSRARVGSGRALNPVRGQLHIQSPDLEKHIIIRYLYTKKATVQQIVVVDYENHSRSSELYVAKAPNSSTPLHPST